MWFKKGFWLSFYFIINVFLMFLYVVLISVCICFNKVLKLFVIIIFLLLLVIILSFFLFILFFILIVISCIFVVLRFVDVLLRGIILEVLVCFLLVSMKVIFGIRNWVVLCLLNKLLYVCWRVRFIWVNLCRCFNCCIVLVNDLELVWFVNLIFVDVDELYIIIVVWDLFGEILNLEFKLDINCFIFL